MFFDLFRRKKNKEPEITALSEADRKWNKLWEMWSQEDIESPYNELMNYHSEVANGGHYQYFLNTENNGDLNKEIEALRSILPEVLKDNLQSAFNAYTELENDKNIDSNEKTLKICDNTFWKNEEAINEIIKSFSDTVIL